MNNKEVMKQALDALESYQVLSCVGGGAYDPECADDKVCEAVEHLRAAIAQGEPTVKESLIVESEPVAIRHSWDGHGWLYTDSGSGSGWRDAIDQPNAEFVYASPQAQPDESGDDLTIAYMAGAASKKFKTLRTDGYSLNQALGQRLVDSDDEFVAYLEPVADYVPLSDEDIDGIGSTYEPHSRRKFARLVERAVRGVK